MHTSPNDPFSQKYTLLRLIGKKVSSYESMYTTKYLLLSPYELYTYYSAGFK